MKDMFKNPIFMSAFVISVAIIIASIAYSLSNYYSSVTPFNRCLNEYKHTPSEVSIVIDKYRFCRAKLE